MLILRRNPCLFTGYTGKDTWEEFKHKSKITKMTKNEKRIQRDRTPEQKWEARLVTSEPWECPAGAREVSSSAGCWCSPAVVQPCSLSHPRPASCTDRAGEDDVVIMSLSESHVISSVVCSCKHDGHNDFVLQDCFTRGC